MDQFGGLLTFIQFLLEASYLAHPPANPPLKQIYFGEKEKQSASQSSQVVLRSTRLSARNNRLSVLSVGCTLLDLMSASPGASVTRALPLMYTD